MTQPLRRGIVPREALIGASAPEQSGIVHLGLGNFHRAHAATYTAQALAHEGGEWGIRGFSHASRTVVESMRKQESLYSVLRLTDHGAEAGVVDVHRGVGVASEDPESVVSSIADPAHRILTLTVSEFGYSRNSATGTLDLDDEGIRADLVPGAMPRTALGMMARGLERRAEGGEPFTVLSCDNLQSAGQVTHDVLREFLHAANARPDVLDYAETQVSYPNAMVDRIVPKTTAAHGEKVAEVLGVIDECPVPAEEFSMWVMEDDFAAGRPVWERAGAVFSDEVEAYEMVKLRLLNGSHSLIAYLGILSGGRTIADAWGMDFIRQAVLAGISDDYLPTFELPSGFDARTYVDELSRRWSNSLIDHATTQVGSDGSLKLLQRIPGAALHALEGGRVPHFLALCVAAWIACVVPPRGFDAGSLAQQIREPSREALLEAVEGAETLYEHARRILEGGFFPSQLAGHEEFTARVAELLQVIVRHGARAAAAEAVAAR